MLLYSFVLFCIIAVSWRGGGVMLCEVVYAVVDSGCKWFCAMLLWARC